MKKTLLLLLVCTVSTQLIAQKTNSPKAETKAQPAVAENDLVPPPPPPAIEKVKFTPPAIVNDKGYQVSVHYNNGKNMVYMKKDGVTQKVSMDKWMANRSYYESKYGELPPPPPPPPAPPTPPTAPSKE